MKNIMVYICLAVCLLFAGCSQDVLDAGNESNAVLKPQLPEEGISKTLSVPEKICNSLQYKLYVFRAPRSKSQPVSSDFVCKEESKGLTFEEFKEYPINLSHKDLVSYVYKLVAVATPSSKPEIESLFNPESEKSLAGLSLRRTYAEDGKLITLSKDNYWGEGDVTDEAIEAGKVDIGFERAVGELVFDFGKYEGSSPVALSSSALDRVYNITADVQNYTESVMLWDENKVEVKNETESCDYNLSGYLTKDYKIDTSLAVPDEENRKGGDLVFGTASTTGEDMELPEGVTRFYAPYQLLAPAANDVKVTLTFHYYDTYSESGESGETAGDYVTKTVTLNIPHNGKKLEIAPNAYTRTKVKLQYDRIIDIGRDVKGVILDPTYDLYVE